MRCFERAAPVCPVLEAFHSATSILATYAFVQCGLRHSGTVEGRQNAISDVSWFVLDTSTSQSQSYNGHTLESLVECQLYRVDREQATYLSSSASELLLQCCVCTLYNTWLLVKSTSKSVIFSFLFVCI